MKYPKINGIYKRYDHITTPPSGAKKGDFIIGEYSCPEYSILENIKWEWSEKLNGTNCRIYGIPGDPYSIKLEGRNEGSSIPAPLIHWFEKWREIYYDIIVRDFPDGVTLYGEGMGSKIQKNQGAVKEYEIILFDVMVDKYWLKREAVTEIAKDIGLRRAAILEDMTLIDAIESFVYGDIQKSNHYKCNMEGWVGIPKFGLLDRSGKRIITKLKFVDFENKDRFLNEGK